MADKHTSSSGPPTQRLMCQAAAAIDGSQTSRCARWRGTWASPRSRSDAGSSRPTSDPPHGAGDPEEAAVFLATETDETR